MLSKDVTPILPLQKYCCRRVACAWGVGLVLAVLVYRRVAQMVTATEEFAGRIERGDFAARFTTEAGGGMAAPAKSALTTRQIEVLRLLALGRSVKEIAFELQISAKTVETYRAQLMARLDLHDIASLVRYAIRTGLINAE